MGYQLINLPRKTDQEVLVPHLVEDDSGRFTAIEVLTSRDGQRQSMCARIDLPYPYYQRSEFQPNIESMLKGMGETICYLLTQARDAGSRHAREELKHWLNGG